MPVPVAFSFATNTSVLLPFAACTPPMTGKSAEAVLPVT
jgi:hypothetical protein